MIVKYVDRERLEKSIAWLSEVIAKSLILEGSTDYCYAPEWWTHRAIFLKFHPKTKELIVHDGVCAKVYADGKLIYSYELFDMFKTGGKRFGGDTWGAITATPDSVFFGGFVYADVSLDGHNLVFTNKYSHIHRIGHDGRTVSLVWYDGPGGTNYYVGEVTDMLYSPKEDAILFTRGDGGKDIWKLDLNTMEVTKLTDTNMSLLKMELFDDMIITGGPDVYGTDGHIVIYNLRDRTTKVITDANLAYYIGSRLTKMGGQVVQTMNRVWIFGSGSAVEFEPKYDVYYHFPFFRFNKSKKVVGRRSQKVYINGIPIVAVNAMDVDDEPRAPAGLLLRFNLPVPQIVMPTGYVTGLETDGKYIYIASTPQNHSYRGNPVTYQPGRGGIFAIPVSEVFRKPLAPIEFHDEVANWSAGDYYLGVPISGFSKKILKVKAPSSLTLRIVFYSLWPGGDFTEYLDMNLEAGLNTIDISSYSGIVAIAPTSNVSGIVYFKLILEP